MNIGSSVPASHYRVMVYAILHYRSRDKPYILGGLHWKAEVFLEELAYYGSKFELEGRYDGPNTLPDRKTMVHLFEWKWTDIAKECEDFLQYYGYGAVQVSPPNEHITLTQNNDMPWWVRYQTVSYKLISRSGNEEEFIDMVNRCNKVGVRIVVDVVMNHMVPFTISDFNDYRCNASIDQYDTENNATNVRNCRLLNLLDLDQSKPYVQEKLAAFLNRLVDIGVAGFRFDGSKHMWPEDLEAIQEKIKDLRADVFGRNKRPFIVHEVTDRGVDIVKGDEYVHIGRVTNFNYGPVLTRAVRGITRWGYLQTLGPGYSYGMLADNDMLNFIDNHDNQRGGDVLCLGDVLQLLEKAKIFLPVD
ncbi:alpha amylase, catalytic domain protein [Oesophagostomum dentatum]|uniref:alpha-amylase n=1 Tax=Oesophagostomum dentatum TaxID=61180 RepID=A0A0B1TED6_OESDE|nr:alpha amylase, catalytic domain protein [Oesophagostomum dentatum]